MSTPSAKLIATINELQRIALICPAEVSSIFTHSSGHVADFEVQATVGAWSNENNEKQFSKTFYTDAGKKSEDSAQEVLSELRCWLKDVCGWEVPEAASPNVMVFEGNAAAKAWAASPEAKARIVDMVNERRNFIEVTEKEQRRFEAAKAAMQGILASPTNPGEVISLQLAAVHAVSAADKLLAELAKGGAL